MYEQLSLKEYIDPFGRACKRKQIKAATKRWPLKICCDCQELRARVVPPVPCA